MFFNSLLEDALAAPAKRLTRCLSCTTKPVSLPASIRAGTGSACPLNPVGLGYDPSDWKLVNHEPPRIENPKHPVARPTHKPLPPLPAFWQPRPGGGGL